MTGAGDEQFSKRAETGADFQHLIRGREFGGVDDAAQLVLVVEEILAQRLGQLDLARGQDLLHFGQFHGAEKMSGQTEVLARNCRWRALTVVVSWAAVMVSGGVKPITLPSVPSGRRR